MGLDMYLTKRVYVGAYFEHREVMGEVKLTKNIKGEQKPIAINTKRISSISEQVGYWRKANHIHQWFVDNVQDGKDECQEAEVSIDKLKELLEVCQNVKAEQHLAPELLPSQEGFFFGGTEYDKYYFRAIDATIEIIENILKEHADEEDGDWSASYYYQSSW